MEDIVYEEITTEEMIMGELLEEIVKNQFKIDEKLPSENSLARKYGVSRIMVRNAYEKLETMQYVYSIQGKGRYLRPRLKKINLLLSGNESFTEKIREQGYEIITENILCVPIHYNKKIYELLQIEEGQAVYKIGRLRYIDQWPVAIHMSYLSQSVFENIAEEGKTITSIFDYYRSKGYEAFTCPGSTLCVSTASSVERRLLKCSSSIPMITVASSCMDQKTGMMLETTVVKYRSDCFKYTV